MRILARDEGMTQQELGKCIFSDPSTVTAILRLLEKRGMVSRLRDERDGRVQRVHLTQQGRRLLRALIRSVVPMRVQVGRAIPPEHQRLFLKCLERIAVAMESDTGQMPRIPRRRLQTGSVPAKPANKG
jgi:DNA-binding MarR family transcriptional regulator